MKAEGIEYDERMELLENVSYPKPLEELLQGAFHSYRQGHPWVDDYELVAEVRRARHVRARDELRRVHRLLPARAVGRPGAALPRGRLRRAAPHRAGRGEDRAAAGPHRVARRARPAGRLQPPRRVGSAAPPGRRGPGRRAAAGRAAGCHAQRTRVPGAGAQRAVPPGRAVRTAGVERAWASWTRRPAGTPRRGRTRSRTTSRSTRRSAPARTRAARRCCIIEQEPDVWKVRQIFDDPAGDHDWGISAEVDLAASDEAGIGRAST